MISECRTSGELRALPDVAHKEKNDYTSLPDMDNGMGELLPYTVINLTLQ